MKIFLSWSGEYTRNIAEIFRQWVPCVLQNVHVFISSGDIQAVERWQSKINAALLDIDFGIVFISKNNKDQPWIMFESGALAKNLDSSRVVPVLCDASEIDLSKSPLLQFQYVQLNRDGIFSLIRSIYSSMDSEKISQVLFDKTLETWWPQLQASIGEVQPEKQSRQRDNAASTDDRIDRLESAIGDVLGLVRTLSRDFEKLTSYASPALPKLSRPDFYFDLEDKSSLVNFHQLAERAFLADSEAEIRRFISYVRRRSGLTSAQREELLDIADRKLRAGFKSDKSE